MAPPLPPCHRRGPSSLGDAAIASVPRLNQASPSQGVVLTYRQVSARPERTKLRATAVAHPMLGSINTPARSTHGVWRVVSGAPPGRIRLVPNTVPSHWSRAGRSLLRGRRHSAGVPHQVLDSRRTPRARVVARPPVSVHVGGLLNDQTTNRTIRPTCCRSRDARSRWWPGVCSALRRTPIGSG
jgi:hypothetical protein